MGLILLPIVLLIAVVWLAAALLGCFVVGVVLRSIPFGKLLLYPAYVAVFALVWYLPNRSALKEQERIDTVTAQCGWTVNRSVKITDGVFVESRDGPRWDDFRYMYPSVEHQVSPDEFIRTFAPRLQYPVREKNSSTVHYSYVDLPEKPDQHSNHRTLKYGIRYTDAVVAERIKKFERTILDFDSNEVLAKHIQYEYKPHNSQSLFGLAFALVTYQPHGCGAELGLDNDLGYQRVLIRPEAASFLK